MKTRFVAAMLLGAVLLPPAARPAAAAGLTQEKLNGIFKKLEANGELWLKDEQIPADAKVDLNSVRFDKDSAAYLEPILRSSRREPSRLWAINKLLNRLQQADAETIQAVLPAVKALHGRIKGTYRSFPKLTDRQADSLKLPPYDERITTAFIMGRMALLDKQRDAKVAREVPLAKHNEAVYDLEKNTYRLMCLAGDPREDTACAKALFVEEGRGNAIFITIADAISEHARKMTPERARKLYPLFRPHLSRLAMQAKRKYINPGKADLSRTETSAYDSREDYAGIKVLGAYNRVVEAAQLPDLQKVRVPSAEEIEQFQKKRRESKGGRK